MALTGTNRGTGASNSVTSPNSNTTYAFSPASNCTAGALVVLCISADNSASGGSSNNINSVTDSLGNTWTKRNSLIYDPGAANAGIQGATFETYQTAGTLTTGATITVTFGATTTAKSYTLQEFTGSVGKPTYKGLENGTGGATANPSRTTGTILNGQAVLCMLAMEAGTTQTCTADADTTNGSWSTQQYSEVGSTTSGNCIASQFKVVTATATQTYNPTLGLSCDIIIGVLIIGEDIAVSTGRSDETDTALALTKTKMRAVGVSTETNTALALAVARLKLTGVAVETESAMAGTGGSLPSGLTFRLDYSDLASLTLSGSDITVAQDIYSGGSWTVDQLGSHALPTSETDTYIGLSARFDGADEVHEAPTLTWADAINADEHTIFVRYRLRQVDALSSDTFGASHFIGNGASDCAIVVRQKSGGGYEAAQYAWDTAERRAWVDGVLLDTAQIVVGRHTGGNIETRIGNGTPVTTACGNIGDLTGQIQIGANINFTTRAYLDGAISDVLVWDRALTEGEISTVLAWLEGTGGGLVTKIRAAGVSTGTETALALAHTKVRTTGLGTETNTALALALDTGFSQVYGQADEADTALAVGRVKSRTTATAAGTDAALALAAMKIRAAGIAAETDAALTFPIVKIQTVTTATEIDTALSLAVVKTRAVELATETDEAIARPRAGYYVTTPGVETDAALQLGRAYSVGVAAEVGAAITLTATKLRVITTATELDASASLTATKIRTAGVPIETDEALQLGRTYAVGVSLETDEAITLDVAVGVISIGVAVETDAAFALSRYPPRRPRASVVPAWASNGLKGSLPYGFWRRWL